MNSEKKIVLLKNPIAGFKEEYLKIKLLNSDEILISLDRLTRFKYPPINRNRVYSNILTGHLISPKMTLKSINSLPLSSIELLVQIIWNKSIKALIGKENSDISLNKYLAFEEIKTFSSKKMLEELVNRELPDNPDENSIKKIIKWFNEEGIAIDEKQLGLLNLDIYDEIYVISRCANALDLKSFVEFIASKKSENYHKNIARLIKLCDFIKKEKLKVETKEELLYLYEFQAKSKKFNFSFPAQLLLIAEGITEETLLPIFCSASGLDFNRKGIQLIGAGGKNQVLKIYNDLKSKISIPVFIMLDADGVDIQHKLDNIIRPNDSYFIISEGEFEDILKPELICRSINNFYKSEGYISIEDIDNSTPKTKLLNNLWKEKGFGEFSKSTFAKLIAENITGIEDISEPLSKIIQKARKIMKKKRV